jgi:N-acyl-D-amino-acid deacylase
MRIGLGAFFVNTLLLSLSFFAPALAQVATYDLVLRNARIADGSGRAAYRGDVAIRGDTIVLIAPSISETSRRVIDVGGQVVAPGFIDVHNHARGGIFQVPRPTTFCARV